MGASAQGKHRGQGVKDSAAGIDSHHAGRRLALAQTWKTLADVVPSIAATYPQDPLCWYRVERAWGPVDAEIFSERSGRIALGLLEKAIDPGAAVAVIGQNSFDRTLLESALSQCGALIVPLDDGCTEDDLRWLLRDSSATCVVVDNDETASLVKEISNDNPTIESVWTMQSSTKHRDINDLLMSASADYQAELAGVRPDIDPYGTAVRLYEFGVAPRPVGVDLSHRQVLDAALSWAEFFPRPKSAGEALLTYQAPSSVFVRACKMVCWAVGFGMAHSDPSRVSRDVEDLGPAIMLSDRRFFDRLFDTALRKAGRAGHSYAFWSALGREPERESRPLWESSSTRRAAVDRLAQSLGGNLRYVLTDEFELKAEAQDMLGAVGCTALPCFSIAESAGPLATVDACVAERAPRESGTGDSDTVCELPGIQLLPGVSAKPGRGEEVLVKAPWLLGTLDRSAAGQRSDTEDKWLNTGRLGRIVADHVELLGHSSPRIVTTAGTTVNPELIEEKLREHALINHAVVVGQGQPCLGALVTLNLDAAASWLSGHTRKALPFSRIVSDPDVLNAVRRAVEMTNETLRVSERIGPVRVLTRQFSRDEGHLTSGLKIRRDSVLAAFAGEVSALFGSPKPR